LHDCGIGIQLLLLAAHQSCNLQSFNPQSALVAGNQLQAVTHSGMSGCP